MNGFIRKTALVSCVFVLLFSLSACKQSTQSQEDGPKGIRITSSLTREVLIGKRYEEVQKIILAAGFNNLELLEIIGLPTDDGNKVTEVSIDGDSEYVYNDRFPVNSHVVITYGCWTNDMKTRIHDEKFKDRDEEDDEAEDEENKKSDTDNKSASEKSVNDDAIISKESSSAESNDTSENKASGQSDVNSDTNQTTSADNPEQTETAASDEAPGTTSTTETNGSKTVTKTRKVLTPEEIAEKNNKALSRASSDLIEKALRGN